MSLTDHGSVSHELILSDLYRVYFDADLFFLKNSAGLECSLVDVHVSSRAKALCFDSGLRDVRKKQLNNFISNISIDTKNLDLGNEIVYAEIILGGYSNNYIARLFHIDGSTLILKSMPRHDETVENVEFQIYKSILNKCEIGSSRNFFKCLNFSASNDSFLLLLEDMESIKAVSFEKKDSLDFLLDTYNVLLCFSEIMSECLEKKTVSLASNYKIPDISFLADEDVPYFDVANRFSKLFMGNSKNIPTNDLLVISHNDFAFSNVCLIEAPQRVILFDFGKVSLSPLGADFGSALFEFYRYNTAINISHYIFLTSAWLRLNCKKDFDEDYCLVEIIEMIFLAKFLRRLKECRVGERKVYKLLIKSNQSVLKNMFERSIQYLSGL